MALRSSSRIPPPPPFDGDVVALADFVLANVLPAPDIVEAFHAALSRYCEFPDPLYVIRAPGWARDKRGTVVSTADGCRVRFSDNAPAWAVHHALFHRREAAFSDFGSFVDGLPTHFFEVTKKVPDSVNSAGWYVAHILAVGDRTPLHEWRGSDLARRFVRNIHPCNLFYVPKEHRWDLGEDAETVAYFASRVRSLYSSVWDDFLRLAGGGDHCGVVPSPVAPRVVPARSGAPALASTRKHTRVSGPDSPASVRDGPQPTADLDPVRYSHSRLCFKRDAIEPLEDGQTFEVVTREGTFRMTKLQFRTEFPNVVASTSYRRDGIYHYKQAPVRARKYLVLGK